MELGITFYPGSRIFFSSIPSELFSRLVNFDATFFSDKASRQFPINLSLLVFSFTSLTFLGVICNPLHRLFDQRVYIDVFTYSSNALYSLISICFVFSRNVRKSKSSSSCFLCRRHEVRSHYLENIKHSRSTQFLYKFLDLIRLSFFFFLNYHIFPFSMKSFL